MRRALPKVRAPPPENEVSTMVRKRSRALDLIVYLAIRAAVCLIQTLSWRGALGLARGLAWLAYRVDRRHRLVAADNIRRAFGHLDETDVDRLVRSSYLHLTTMLVEMIRLPRKLNRDNVDSFVEHGHPNDLNVVKAWVATGRPRLVLTGHFGNWEVLSYVTGLVGFRGGIVARRLDNPYLDRFLARFRRKTGLVLLDKNKDFARILDMLAHGIGLGMVGDQDAGPRGLFVNFFGRPASTFKSIALLSIEYNAPIFVFGAARVGHPMKYRLYFEDLILPEDHAANSDAPRVMTERYTSALERLVRRHPEQYFWLHRRWKSLPQSKVKNRAA
jgi:Kdo2-lipid IVA lauroyltransferase/acyltransferase